jgi:alpha-L-fucosidase
MTMNDTWGYHKADDAWKPPKQIIRNLITCAHDGGNHLNQDQYFVPRRERGQV